MKFEEVRQWVFQDEPFWGIHDNKSSFDLRLKASQVALSLINTILDKYIIAAVFLNRDYIEIRMLGSNDILIPLDAFETRRQFLKMLPAYVELTRRNPRDDKT